jgi:pimeloyl-ACP methyl ester carboxylesterase
MGPLRYYSRTFYEHTAGVVAGGRARSDRAYVQRLWRDRAKHAPSVRGYAYQLWAMSLWSSLPFLGRIQAPTLVVVGDDDPLVPLSNALLMAARIPDARVHVVPDEGHFLLLDDDRSAAPAAVREFLAVDDLSRSSVWCEARTAEDADVERQLRADGLGALPWGAVSAVVRQTLGR